MTPSETRPLAYWAAIARHSFENDLHRLIAESGISRAELAERMGVSPPYITKMLGNAGNATIETMVKFATALNAVVKIRLALDGREFVRVLSVDEAERLDKHNSLVELGLNPASNVLGFQEFKDRRALVIRQHETIAAPLCSIESTSAEQARR
jgi:transcriptional regulator with XRE-family HTH domain